METSRLPKGRVGRPRSFDRSGALEEAMLVFWRHGYETSSIADLTAAMGITAPSLYAAFGDKKRLFLEAMQRYVGDPALMQASIADAPSALEAVRNFMRSAARTYTGTATPPGCLLVSAAASGSEASADIRQAVASFRRAVTASLRRRIAADVKDKVLPGATDAKALAAMVMAVNQGMSILARDGASRADLLALVDVALAGWPRAT